MNLSLATPSLPEDGGTDTVTATLSAATAVPVTIDLGFTGSAAQTTNYSASDISITIPAGSTTGSITLTGIDTRNTTDQTLSLESQRQHAGDHRHDVVGHAPL